MANPSSGHGVKIYVTLTPVASPNVFTLIPELVGEVKVKFNTASKKVTSHDRTMDTYTFSNELVRDEMSLNWNYDPTDTTHVALRDLILARTPVGLRKLGPGGVIGTTEDYTMSGQLSSWDETDAQFEEERKMMLTFRPSGPMRVNGVLIS